MEAASVLGVKVNAFLDDWVLRVDTLIVKTPWMIFDRQSNVKG
jgi:hypothetical protein